MAQNYLGTERVLDNNDKNSEHSGSDLSILATMHDLLEWQWDQAGVMLMQQAEGADGKTICDL